VEILGERHAGSEKEPKEMDGKFLIRYIILMLVLLICIGLAWYLTTYARVPSDAVLAERTETWAAGQYI
jgi:hypothetical protein